MARTGAGRYPRRLGGADARRPRGGAPVRHPRSSRLRARTRPARRPDRRTAPVARPVPGGRDAGRSPDDRAEPERPAGRRAEPLPGDPRPSHRGTGHGTRHDAVPPAAADPDRRPGCGRQALRPAPGSGGTAGHPSPGDDGVRGARRGAHPPHRGGRRHTGDRGHRGHAGRGEDGAGGPRRPAACRAVPRWRALSQPALGRSGQPLARPGGGAVPPAPDAVRAGRADTGNHRRADRAVAGPPEPAPRRRDPGRRGRARPDRPAPAGEEPVPDPGHHPAAASGRRRYPVADPRRAAVRRRDHVVPADRREDRAAAPPQETAAQETAAQIAAVVESCGRLPLAVKLTAGRIARAGLASGRFAPDPVARDGAGRLGDLMDELPSPPERPGQHGAPAPEVTAAFDLSYRALDPDHQQFFRRLGASPCDCFSLPAAAALGGCTFAEAEKALTALLDHHLLSQAPGGQFRFHDLIRCYAAACAGRNGAESGQRQAVGRLLDFYLHTADKADRVLHPFRRRAPVAVTQVPAEYPALGTPDDAAAWLESEWRNIVQIARYADRHEWKHKCADLIDLLADFLEIRAYWDEAAAAHLLALQAARGIADPARIARAALALGAVRQQTGQHKAVIPLAEEAAAIYRSLADRGGEARALDQLGLAYQRTARSREAVAYFEEARILYHAAGDPRGVADTLSHSGIACWHLGRYPEANAHMEEALSLYRRAGDRRGEAAVHNNLGRVHLYNGYHRDALDAYQESLTIFREIGGAQQEAILHQNIATVHRYKGSYEEALAAYRQALRIYRGIGDLPDEAEALNDIGAIYQSAACYDEALAHHQRAQQIAEEIGNLSHQLVAFRLIADVHRGSGRYGEALDHYQVALRLSREIGEPYEEGKILEGIAEATLTTQGFGAARIALRQALDIYERLGLPEAESVRIRMETIDAPFAVRIS